MFGKTIDYWLLRPIAHGRDRMTEEELDRQAESEPEIDVEYAKSRLRKWNRRLDNRIPLNSDLRYLDVGCGRGSLALAFALESGGHVTGIDIAPREIVAASNHAKEFGVSGRTDFRAINVHDMPEDEKFDVILSHDY